MVHARPVACTGRYLVDGSPLIGGGALDTDAVVVGAGRVSIAAGCELTGIRVVARRSSTLVRAKVATCGDLRRITLRGRISAAPACASMRGVLRARGRPTRPFRALRSRCGDLRHDPDGEQCDAGRGCRPQERCTLTCVCEPAFPATTTTAATTTTVESPTSSSETTSTTTGSDTTTSTVVPEPPLVRPAPPRVP
jgi:hypothetical protein